MTRKIIYALCTTLVCVCYMLGCSASDLNELPERYIYSTKDDIWNGYDLSDFPSPTSDEDYMLRRLQNTSLIIEGTIIETKIEENNPASDDLPTMLSTVFIKEEWYGDVLSSEIVVSHAFRRIGQNEYAPRKGDNVILFLTKLSTYDHYLISSVPSYETFYILNPPDDTLLPLYTFDVPSSLTGGTKEELYKAVKETLYDIADGEILPLATVDTAVDVITDKYVKKYERKQKWHSLFSRFKE